ncbi:MULTISPECIES: cryptochrome/photolyase family protein [Pseudomonas]|uniref:Cryptochrome/photolyase family protein n=1 Tax=Pseudomonas syringae TaxID=317 RepID=A0A6B2AQ22_PSESX|nr:MULTISPECIES: cryptochrome/photolyase family protein [Pseudomonas]MCK9718833.1 cryptochrome/photolyase family protein [Pseudomonas syringae pv. syringae]MCK9762310.1 cryptochrome/photolyase family protein [Pseudomonas syringae pv. syringae]MDC6487237.1 cryptochrome/photolyase family protein [Pseudomonas syringae]MDC6497112.1 cryptochrome/photolyase family protein [Pseudomonas syringae]MDC6507666.1 cryptochrome/photolyase family protein [Pseudomonas syringae]
MTAEPLPLTQAPRLHLILGDQLSFDLASLAGLIPERDTVLMVEVMEEASHVPHHPQKIVLIFSAMRHFAEALRERGVRVQYVMLDDPQNTGSVPGELQRWQALLRAEELHITECGDWRLEQSIKDCGLPIQWHADTRFLCSRDEFSSWAHGKKQLRMEFFYREMRRKSRLLLNGDGTPVGGAWNFDAENRKALPKGVAAPYPLRFSADTITCQVLELVGERFASHYGSLDDFDYPVTHVDAQALWEYFLDYGLAGFGDYQDAMATGEPFLFHARISAALNIGLLDLRQVCSDVESAYWSGRVGLNAAEGFIRQLIGWREYVRGVYWLKMPDYAGGNLFGNSRPLPEFYWTGETKMNCMSQAIGQSLKHAYAHHIQRLMVTGNFALLAGIVPEQICEWYLAIYMDAFDWVELPNTLGMVMHADGGYLGSKPYCASGQYIKRMSDYCRGCAYKVTESTTEDACPFNALYWHFLMRHGDLLRRNQRMAIIYKNLDRMAEPKQKALWERGEHLLARLDAGEAL